MRWTPDPDDPGFKGDAVIEYTVDGTTTTTTKPWTDPYLELTLTLPIQNHILTLLATLVSVGGTPVDPKGASTGAAGNC